MTIKERVRKGMNFLDKTMPGWLEHINVDKLDISDGNQCVLGQIANVTMKGKVPHGMSSFSALVAGIYENDFQFSAGDCGFYARQDNAADVTAEWKRAISERKDEVLPCLVEDYTYSNIDAEMVAW